MVKYKGARKGKILHCYKRNKPYYGIVCNLVGKKGKRK